MQIDFNIFLLYMSSYLSSGDRQQFSQSSLGKIFLVQFFKDLKDRKCSYAQLKNFKELLYPALCWVVILLIDGKYLACGLYSKCNSTMTTVDLKDPEMVTH
ncbi:hypothetical protein JZ751_029756 [Albula glossodonta]|uniref:Uncharacterized protein n=1 Tax=Albula glossodonta TaxID=121402 RepID=A0A8T2MVP5_9TELE|nr:hypothetical protein JZ751_029756 [Albula glossodonta]